MVSRAPIGVGTQFQRGKCSFRVQVILKLSLNSVDASLAVDAFVLAAKGGEMGQFFCVLGMPLTP